jgi:transposase InsO family protein
MSFSPQTPNDKILSPAVDLEEESGLNRNLGSPTLLSAQNFFIDPRISHSISSTNDLSTNRATTLNNSTNKRNSKQTKKKRATSDLEYLPKNSQRKKTRLSEETNKKIENYFSKIDEQEVLSESSSNEDAISVQFDSDEEEIQPKRTRKYSNESLGTEETITQEYRDLFLNSSNGDDSSYVPSEVSENESEDNEVDACSEIDACNEADEVDASNEIAASNETDEIAANNETNETDANNGSQNDIANFTLPVDPSVVREFLKENQENRYFSGHGLPEFLQNAECDESIDLKAKFRYEYEKFVAEHPENREAIEEFVKKWKPDRKERKKAGGIPHLKNWKKTLIKNHEVLVISENPLDLMLGRKAIIRRFKDPKTEQMHSRPNIRDYDIQVLLKKSEIPLWLNWAHSYNPDHFGATKMKERLEGIHWVGINDDIENWIEMCPHCEETKPNNIVAPLRAIVSQRPRQRIQIDFFDMGVKNVDPQSGHRYVLLIIDCFTKRVWLRPFKTKHGDLVAQTVWNIFKEKDERPTKIQTDNGGEFANKALTVVAKKLDSRMIHPPPYSPWNDGQVERAVRTFKYRIRSYIKIFGKDNWAKVVPKIEEEYNKTRHSAHKFAPLWPKHLVPPAD